MVFIITSHDQISWLSHVCLWRNPCFYITWLIIDKKTLENAVLNQPIELGQRIKNRRWPVFVYTTEFFNMIFNTPNDNKNWYKLVLAFFQIQISSKTETSKLTKNFGPKNLNEIHNFSNCLKPIKAPWRIRHSQVRLLKWNFEF